MVVAQALALLAWNSAHLALFALSSPGDTTAAAASAGMLHPAAAAGSAAQRLGRDDTGVFAELLAAGVLVTAVPLVLLLRRCAAQPQFHWPLFGVTLNPRPHADLMCYIPGPALNGSSIRFFLTPVVLCHAATTWLVAYCNFK